jgi:uncharacterized protein YgbK (DUF1537 family)
VQFKYCSTFDSTDQGNIGPVIEVLLEAMQVPFTIAMPALPVNRRTQYLGYLFVDGVLLAESHMKDHPLNPMTESNLSRHLRRQTVLRTGLMELTEVRRGAEVVHDSFEKLINSGVRVGFVDATEQSDIDVACEAAVEMKLVTGASGFGMGLPKAWRKLGWTPSRPSSGVVMGDDLPVLILSGSSSTATLHQLEVLRAEGYRTITLDYRELDRVERDCREVLEQGKPVCVFSSAPAESRFAAEVAGEIEAAFAELARRLAPVVLRIVVAGGETSGAVVAALQVRAAEVIAVIDPGVPALRSVDARRLELVLKSGNFGSKDFFLKAIRFREAR